MNRLLSSKNSQEKGPPTIILAGPYDDSLPSRLCGALATVGDATCRVCGGENDYIVVVITPSKAFEPLIPPGEALIPAFLCRRCGADHERSKQIIIMKAVAGWVAMSSASACN